MERVTFFNEENGFAVLKVKIRGRRDLVTVIGSVPSANPGEWLTAEGRWVQDREFGQQFRAELLRSSAPTTREGIEKYLGSGMVRGIGPVYAAKLVEKFGGGIFDIIENYSARLEEVDGIGPERRRQIKAAWSVQKVVREIMVFLHSHGVSSSRAVRIYKTYGENAIAEVRANPYSLALDISGIGFRTADQIAQKIGIPYDSIMRACAGLRHVLLEATGQGHCALPLSLLKEETGKLLLVQDSIIEAGLQRGLANQELMQEPIHGEQFVFVPTLKRAEEAIAARIIRLSALPASYPAINFEKALAWYEQRSGKELAPSQRAALREALTTRLLILTGGPGVGKTTLVNAILKVLRAKKVRCELCAPTGRAAKRLSETTGFEAKTIHRLLEVEPGKGGFVRNETHPLRCDLLVVDESSMVDVLLMHHLLRALPAHASLLLVGDVDQLPSVGPGAVLRNLIESGSVPVVRLTEVFRQAAHSRIITNAHRINEGLMPELGSDKEAADFFFVEREQPDRIADTVLDLVKRRIPNKFKCDPVSDIQVLSPMNRGSLGVRELNLRLQAELNPPRHEEPMVEKFGSQYRVGDKVIQTENNYEKDVFNGDIGRILKINLFERALTVKFEQREVAYDFGELDELSLAYAITIHKSQGSEFRVVVIPLATQHYLLLQRNLVYTAVTRGKQLVVLVGQSKALAMAVRNHQMRARFSGLLMRLQAAAGEKTGAKIL
ncbi:MAG TPA: ATP-dependent RecD-like DNA helicase [Candidatus Limnocylindrales bacterium]|nr:ATP-dependent RecD-like DNA helicase [Candidatus Limnocylindrales bacterium]